jgi:hypothetical protein
MRSCQVFSLLGFMQMDRGEAGTTVIQEIYGLRYEFVHRHGHYMMLHRETGLFREELSELQLKMLESNAIPKLLPLEIQEIDFRIHLLYKLSSKRMMTHVLKVEGIVKQQLFKLLYAIVCALDESGNYMLHAAQYVLKENFIFIGNDYSDVFLTYVPLQLMKEEQLLYKQIGALIEQLASYLKEEESSWTAGLLEACSETFSLASLKQKLLELMGEPLPKNEVKEKQEVAAPISNIPWKSAEPSVRIQDVSEEKTAITFKKETAELTNRTKIILIAGLCLMLALIWSMVLEHQSEAALSIGAGLTILLADIGFVLICLGFPQGWVWWGNRHLTDGVKESNSPYLSAATHQISLQEPVKTDMNKYYQNLHLHTTLLTTARPNATVWLGGAAKAAGIPTFSPKEAYLELAKDGQKQRLPLHGNSFLIGRGETDVDYEMNEAGVSRLHSEIFKAVEGYGVKDLGSKNGTFLNGTECIPYQTYPLKDGDTIRIVRTEFIVRL